MNRFVILIGLFVVIGCGGPLTRLPNDKPDNPAIVTPDKPTDADVFWGLGELIKPAETTTQLCKWVRMLNENGLLSDAGVAKYEKAFEGHTTTGERPLTAADAATLKGLK